ncbi:MAG: class I tRNA ligase family protein, partial [Acidobacteria bacterium]|nr:class I tRNA ligase family protein [Acidobacteriota bacterium]
ALVRDPEGLKMSKTRGNVVDPLEIIEKHGTDALRFALAVMAAPGTDIALSEDRILSYRAFANKIWNAARFLFFNLEKIETRGITLEEVAAPDVRAAAPYAVAGQNALVDRWIFSRLAGVTAQVNDALENYRFHEAAHLVYHFFWGDFCDWYIEWVKPNLSAEDRAQAVAAWKNIFAVFEAALRLLHPFMPFLTEELWQRLPQRAGAKSIALERFPEPHSQWADAQAEREMELLQAIINAARNAKAELKIDAKKSTRARYHAASPREIELVAHNMQTICRLAALLELSPGQPPFDLNAGAIRSAAGVEIYVMKDEALDLKAEAARLHRDIAALAKDIESKQRQLADETFRSRAPQNVVKSMESKLAERMMEIQKLRDRLAQLEKCADASA